MNLDTSNDYTREKLEQSELGKIVMFYEKNPHDKTSELCLDLPAESLVLPLVMLTACWADLLASACCASACIVQASLWRCSCVGNSCWRLCCFCGCSVAQDQVPGPHPGLVCAHLCRR